MPDSPDVALSRIDVVYVFRQNPDLDVREMYYSLRSVARHLKGVGRIWVVGDFPLFKKDVEVPYTVIPRPDPFMTSQHNVRSKLLAAAHCPDISEAFVLMNDDFFILQDLDARAIPAYRNGMIQQHIDWRECNNPNSPYVGALKATLRELQGQRLNTVDFEVHVPAVMRRPELIDVLDDDKFNWSGQWGLLPRSLYGNSVGFKGVAMMDVKVDCPIADEELHRRTSGVPFLSTGKPGLTPAMMTRLYELFGN